MINRILNESFCKNDGQLIERTAGRGQPSMVGPPNGTLNMCIGILSIEYKKYKIYFIAKRNQNLKAFEDKFLRQISNSKVSSYSQLISYQLPF